jgi:hypothetical protein
MVAVETLGPVAALAGYSPAAAVPTSGWSTITALLQTAAGRPVTIEP